MPRCYKQDKLGVSWRIAAGQLWELQKLVAEAGDTSGTQGKGSVRRWKPLLSKVMKTVIDNTSLCVIVICKV
jgi:hypothetical protein